MQLVTATIKGMNTSGVMQEITIVVLVEDDEADEILSDPVKVIKLYEEQRRNK